MKKIPNWYVITGGPNSGKTTTVEYLAKLGYTIVPEYARLLIEKELKKGIDVRQDENRFQDKVAKGKLLMEKEAPKTKIVFLDRGLPDSIAYFRYLKLKFSKKWLKISKSRYRKVFLLAMLPYRKDSARNESKKQAYEIHRQIKKAYKELGYEVIRVPVMPIEDRVKFILKRVSSV